MNQRTYIAIDLKSFYASVECRERGLDPLDTNLVVADRSHSMYRGRVRRCPCMTALHSSRHLQH